VLEEIGGKTPVLVCGLPGSGYVGKLAVDHLVSSFGLRKVAEYSSDAFPPQVEVRVDGTVAPPSGQVFFTDDAQGKGLLVFTADAQPVTSEGEYELSDAVVKLAKRWGAKRVYALAAYITGGFASSPRVFATATTKELAGEVKEKGASLMKDGGVTGMNGLVVGIAALRGLEGACLLGETSGYVVDAAASKAVLEVLSGLVGIRVDTSELEEKAEETKKVISQLRAMAEESGETVQQPRKEPRPGYIG
jgi:uncharacterized protein